RQTVTRSLVTLSDVFTAAVHLAPYHVILFVIRRLNGLYAYLLIKINPLVHEEYPIAFDWNRDLITHMPDIMQRTFDSNRQGFLDGFVHHFVQCISIFNTAVYNWRSFPLPDECSRRVGVLPF